MVYILAKSGELHCPLSFCTYSGFRKHLTKVHSQVDQEIDIVHDVSTQRECEAECSSDSPNVVATLQKSESSVDTSQLSSMCGSIVAHLQASGLSESAVQTIVCSMEEVVNDVKSEAKNAVLKTMSSENTSSDTPGSRIDNCFDQLGNPFTALNTESKRRKYYNEKWEIVEPKECVLGVRLDLRRDRITGVYNEIPVTDKCTYVPILSTLKSIFKNDQVRESFLRDKQSENGIYKDINDGSYCQNHALFSQQKHALQILLYYDDFETANPFRFQKGDLKKRTWWCSKIY